MERENAWEKYSEEDKDAVFAFAEEYRKFISDHKTERECVNGIRILAEAAGFRDLEDVMEKKISLKAGDRVFAVNKGKGMALYVIGRQPMEKGMNILGAHIDSPRLDLKQNPLYEDTDLALLDTHYYGGVKKYQWVTLPLALHGVVAKKDGTVVEINIGEKPEDPVFGVSDLLIHLSQEQLKKNAAAVIDGEDLNVLIGSMPFTAPEDGDDEKKKEAKKEGLRQHPQDFEGTVWDRRGGFSFRGDRGGSGGSGQGLWI